MTLDELHALFAQADVRKFALFRSSAASVKRVMLLIKTKYVVESYLIKETGHYGNWVSLLSVYVALQYVDLWWRLERSISYHFIGSCVDN